MATRSHRATTRVVCRIFIKATPQAVWNAITMGTGLEADPPGRLVFASNAGGPDAWIRSGLVSVELRDTLTGHTAVTVSRKPDGAPGAPASGSVGTHEWERLLGDLKTVLEARGRYRHEAATARSSRGRPVPLRLSLAAQAQAF